MCQFWQEKEKKMSMVRLSLERANVVKGFDFCYVAGVKVDEAVFSLPLFQQRLREVTGLRKPSQDFLGNDGNPIFDGDKKLLMTGCETTARAFEAIFPPGSVKLHKFHTPEPLILR